MASTASSSSPTGATSLAASLDRLMSSPKPSARASVPRAVEVIDRFAIDKVDGAVGGARSCERAKPSGADRGRGGHARSRPPASRAIPADSDQPAPAGGRREGTMKRVNETLQVSIVLAVAMLGADGGPRVGTAGMRARRSRPMSWRWIRRSTAIGLARFQAGGMIFALRRDVVSLDGPEAAPGGRPSDAASGQAAAADGAADERGRLPRGSVPESALSAALGVQRQHRATSAIQCEPAAASATRRTRTADHPGLADHVRPVRRPAGDAACGSPRDGARARARRVTSRNAGGRRVAPTDRGSAPTMLAAANPLAACERPGRPDHG